MPPASCAQPLGKGSLVWAKLPAFPWWPAKVTEVAGSDVYVTFCGTQDLGTVLRDATVPYTSKLNLREAKQKERWKKKFKQAIEEANSYAGLAADAAPADTQGEVMSHDEAEPQVREEAAKEAAVEVAAEAAVEEVEEEAADEEEVVQDAQVAKAKAKAEDSSEDEGAGPSKGGEQTKGASSKRQLPADPGLPGWREPRVGNVSPGLLARATHRAPPVARRPAEASTRRRWQLGWTSQGPHPSGPVSRAAQANTRAPERERAQVEDLPRATRRGDQIARYCAQ